MPNDNALPMANAAYKWFRLWSGLLTAARAGRLQALDPKETSAKLAAKFKEHVEKLHREG